MEFLILALVVFNVLAALTLIILMNALGQVSGLNAAQGINTPKDTEAAAARHQRISADEQAWGGPT